MAAQTVPVGQILHTNQPNSAQHAIYAIAACRRRNTGCNGTYR